MLHTRAGPREPRQKYGSVGQTRLTAPHRARLPAARGCRRAPFFFPPPHSQTPLRGRKDRRGRGGTGCCSGEALREAPGGRHRAAAPHTVRGPPSAPQPQEESAHRRRWWGPRRGGAGRGPVVPRRRPPWKAPANGERAPVRPTRAQRVSLARGRGRGRKGVSRAAGSGSASAGGPGQSAARRWRASRSGFTAAAAGCCAPPLPPPLGRPRRYRPRGGGPGPRWGGSERRKSGGETGKTGAAHVMGRCSQ